MLAISILLGINMLLELVTKHDIYVLSASALIISVWEQCFPLAIILIGFCIGFGIIKAMLDH